MSRRYDYGLDEVCEMPAGPEKAVQLAVYGLWEDSAHHKQWYLEQIAIALGVDLEELDHEMARAGNADRELGIVP